MNSRNNSWVKGRLFYKNMQYRASKLSLFKSRTYPEQGRAHPDNYKTPTQIKKRYFT